MTHKINFLFILLIVTGCSIYKPVKPDLSYSKHENELSKGSDARPGLDNQKQIELKRESISENQVSKSKKDFKIKKRLILEWPLVKLAKKIKERKRYTVQSTHSVSAIQDIYAAFLVFLGVILLLFIAVEAGLHLNPTAWAIIGGGIVILLIVLLLFT